MSKPDANIIRPRKTETEEVDLDITPMIDIVFLLLAFFVVVSKMDPTTAVTLPKAERGLPVPEKNCVVFVVTRGDTPQSHMIYKGRAKDDAALVPDGDASDQESDVAEYVDNELSKRPQVAAILIKAETDVRTGAVEVVKRGIATSENGITRQIFVGVETR